MRKSPIDFERTLMIFREACRARGLGRHISSRTIARRWMLSQVPIFKSAGRHFGAIRKYPAPTFQN